MKVVFYASDKPREHMLANAFEEGVTAAGDEFEMRRTAEYGETIDGDDLKYPGPSPDTDVACFFGVKGRSRFILKDHLAMGRATLFFDKGYTRDKGEGGHTEYSRVSVNGATPLHYMMQRTRTPDRWKRLGDELKEKSNVVNSGGHILYCGSSSKYHEFHGLAEPTDYAEKLIRGLRKNTQRQIIYRPKPSATHLGPVKGVAFSRGPDIADAMRGCWCLVTHGSAASMDAILAGIPALVLGEAIARPVAETEIENIDDPRWFKLENRTKWAWAMAYTQWTTEELRTGEAWVELKKEIELQRKERK